MSDSFSFGQPTRRGPRLERPNLRRAPRTPKERPEPALGRSRGSIVVVTLLAVVALVGGYAVLSVMHGGGQAAADADRTALSQVDAAQDTQAQVALQQVLGAARVLQAEAAQPPGFDRAGPGSLERYDPSLGVVPGASNGPATVSVAATAQGWGAAAMSASGTCFWIHQDAGSTVTYGSGSPCTGEAALAASGIAW